MTRLILAAFLSVGVFAAAPVVGAEMLTAAQASAERGDAVAQARVGAMYYLGEGTEENLAEAAKWLAKAADQGVVEAQVMMAALYDIGRGVPQNYSEATAWYRKAAASGHEPSQGILNYYKNEAIRATKALQIAKQYARELLRK